MSREYAKQLETLTYLLVDEDKGRIIEGLSFLPDPSSSQFSEIVEELTWDTKAECEEAARRMSPVLDHPHFVHVLKEGRKWKIELNDKRWPHWNDLKIHCRKIGVEYDSFMEKFRERFSVSQFPEAVEEFIKMTSKGGAK